ncbi:hypothetical protein F5051DRAFT_475078 [Lentinula edodes]|nr:hypothetical protein F5051DRAFT_475078 [Lentinula edodes]
MESALYDSAPGELSIIKVEILLAFEPDNEWLLVRSTNEGGKAGYIRANYVETHVEGTEEEAAEQQPADQRIIVPPSPTTSPPTYVDPVDRAASSKLKADGIKTWSVSEVDNKGKKMKGTLSIGSGAVFFASEISKAAVQKWPTSSFSNINVEKAKHVQFDVEGGVSLHFNVGCKSNCDAIVAELESSKALALQPSEEAPAPTPSRSPPPPCRGAEEEEEPEEEGEMAVALYPFTADGDDELSVIEGEQLLVLQKDGDEWWKCRNAEGAEGVVAASYIELAPSNRQTAPRSTPLEEETEEEEEKEYLAAKEAQPREKAETEAAAAAVAERARKEEEGRRERIRKRRERRGRRKREQRLLRPSGPRGRRLQPLAILRLHLHQPTTVVLHLTKTALALHQDEPPPKTVFVLRIVSGFGMIVGGNLVLKLLFLASSTESCGTCSTVISRSRRSLHSSLSAQKVVSTNPVKA